MNVSKAFAALSPEAVASSVEALRLHFQRAARADHPDGTFDKAGRWYPSEGETCACCSGLRAPTRAYPLSYNSHCRSLEHCENLADADHADVLTVRRQLVAQYGSLDAVKSLFVEATSAAAQAFTFDMTLPKAPAEAPRARL